MFGGSVFSSDTSPQKPKLRTFPLAQRTFNLKKFAEPRCERAATRFGEFFKLKPPNGGTHRQKKIMHQNLLCRDTKHKKGHAHYRDPLGHLLPRGGLCSGRGVL